MSTLKHFGILENFGFEILRLGMLQLYFISKAVWEASASADALPAS
jgi:hypothetical protein